MRKRRFGPGRVPRRGFFWLLATLLALALAGLGLEHGGGSAPASLSGVLSVHHAQAAPANGPNKNQGPGRHGETNAQPNKAGGGDDANHVDNDCDHSGDNCTKGGPKPPPPQKCGHDDEKAEGLHGKANAQEDQNEKQACKISAGHKPPKH
jgi:hypothetical protein